MSWLFSRALVEEYSPGTFSDGEPCAQLSVMPTPHKFWRNDKMMEFSDLSRFGLTCAVLTESHGEELLMSFLVGFHVKHLAGRQEEGSQQETCGLKCSGSSGKLSRILSLLKTYQKSQSNRPLKISSKLVIQSAPSICQRKTWVLTTFGKDFGYLHTPTTKANYSAASMQKWNSAKNFTTAFGRPTPTNQEWMMGWPIGWTDLKPLEMVRFREWQRQHSPCCEINNKEEEYAA